MHRPTAHVSTPSLVRAAILGIILTLLTGALVPPANAATVLDLTGGSAAQQEAPTALVEGLRQGGRVLLVRHALTDQNQKDTDRQHLENCATQRNLSEAGREQSTLIGQELRRLGVPIGAVLASPYCRALETARLAFGEVEAAPDLVSQSADDPPGERERLTAALQVMLSQPPTPGTNTVLVTHFLNINDATLLDVEEGEIIVALPDGLGGYAVEGQVKAADWSLYPTP